MTGLLSVLLLLCVLHLSSAVSCMGCPCQCTYCPDCARQGKSIYGIDNGAPGNNLNNPLTSGAGDTPETDTDFMDSLRGDDTAERRHDLDGLSTIAEESEGDRSMVGSMQRSNVGSEYQTKDCSTCPCQCSYCPQCAREGKSIYGIDQGA